jgi:hypothetical protein
MGYPCEVRARVNSDGSDVAYVIKVYSARPVQQVLASAARIRLSFQLTAGLA